jgi:hypothetical protein
MHNYYMNASSISVITLTSKFKRHRMNKTYNGNIISSRLKLVESSIFLRSVPGETP